MLNNKLDQAEELAAAKVAGLFELGCWTTLGLTPLLYWVNGPAVSSDQLVIRTALVVLAACGAVGLRLWAWLHKE